MDLFSQLENYDEYNSLTKEEKKSLYPNNFWKIANGKEPINVPNEDTQYWKYWNSKIENQAKNIFKEKQRQKKLQNERGENAATIG